MLSIHGTQQGDAGDVSASASSCFLSSGSSLQSLLVSPVGTQPGTEVKGVVDAAATVASEPPSRVDGGTLVDKTEHTQQAACLKVLSPCCRCVAVSAFSELIAESNMFIIFFNRKCFRVTELIDKKKRSNADQNSPSGR